MFTYWTDEDEMKTKILLIGDTHIPSRAKEIDQRITEKIRSEGVDYLLCTGDLTDESVIDFYRDICSDCSLHVVSGNMDHLPLRRKDEIEVGNLRIGLIHGDGIYPRGDVKKLSDVAERMDVDILVSGHTHRPMIEEVRIGMKKVLLLNPGSATGAWGGSSSGGKPSFIILEVDDEHIRIRLFELDKELKEKIFSFKK